MESALSYAAKNIDRFIEQLESFLKIPSVSTDRAYADSVRECAHWLADEFERIGISNTEVLDTEGHPVVLAGRIENPSLPTVLIYGHYDVQPADPEELWETPPFEPTRRNGDLYARGACDDKGQLFMHVKAAESYLDTEGELPINLIFLIEGEEEVGSKHLPAFLETHRERLDADAVLISDTSMYAKDVPSITYSLRGLTYVQVELTGPDRDLHSGLYGGAIENPINVLANLIGSMHDERHQIMIPGFYDDVRNLTPEERRVYRELPFDAEEWMEEVGVQNVRTEQGYSILEATTARPTLDVNGIWGGYQGEGAKTVLPSTAGAKLSMRLVPDQDPEDIARKTRRYLADQLPDTIQLEFTELQGGYPVMMDPEHPAVQSAADAMEAVLEKRPLFVRSGGTIPVVAEFKHRLDLETAMMGFGLHSDAIHSPNEHFGLDRFAQGVEASIRFMERYRNRTAGNAPRPRDL
jgi:acetylornithine deacetylase/succinyl-diaminopimelate desuccinylase-like protein